MRRSIAHFDADFRGRICRQSVVSRRQKGDRSLSYLVGCRNGASAEAVGAVSLFGGGSVVGVLAACRTLWNAKNGTKNPEHAEGRGEETHNTGRENREEVKTRTSHGISFA